MQVVVVVFCLVGVLYPVCDPACVTMAVLLEALTKGQRGVVAAVL